ncbi:MAG: membrane protein insertion efficiency factor YidD [Acidobacteriota bacterium]
MARVRRTVRIGLLVFAVLCAWDASRPPAAQAGAAAAVWAIRAYQATLSPVIERTGVRCRFTPSCSRYAVAVITRDGWLVGSWRAFSRVLRCGPWTPVGTLDTP